MDIRDLLNPEAMNKVEGDFAEKRKIIQNGKRAKAKQLAEAAAMDNSLDLNNMGHAHITKGFL